MPAVFMPFLNVDNLVAEPDGVSDMVDRLQIAAYFESMEILFELRQRHHTKLFLSQLVTKQGLVTKQLLF
jgi:hypothetical protein